MSRAVEESNRAMLRARDAMDRAYAVPLDIPAYVVANLVAIKDETRNGGLLTM
ncbi:hypothetical protein OHA01_25630 [Micromonospora zamorensis]|uniref:hypothetical protein n=1 Tax=Micromonospora zamorensis TaxID=709883 RepID=UPI00081FCCD3|nr:hypothetical protein [Micromonospora zamorensis]WTE85907.1 hypothetical protein OHA01_25630 [Micromonospora zamorensis]SCG66096.1 hypothetical protein GA0070619_5295 [Micromonospora zamorensis]